VFAEVLGFSSSYLFVFVFFLLLFFFASIFRCLCASVLIFSAFFCFLLSVYFQVSAPRSGWIVCTCTVESVCVLW
jgi:hypothetical protein